MWDKIGLVRTEASLLQAVDLLGQFVPYLWQGLDSIEDYEAANLLNVALLICRSGLWRLGSRGSHYRSDYPDSNSAIAYYDVLRR